MKKDFIVITVIGILLYLPSLFGPFLWDDEDFVYANQYVKDFRVDKFFTESQTAGRGKVSNYYRPLPQLSYATTHTIFGFTPFWFHLLNILVHIGAACAIYYFFKLFLEKNQLKPNPIPLLVSLFFLIHPVQTEAVSYISGLSDPLFTLFGFLALIYFLKHKIWWSLCFFCLCLLSKETGLIFLPLLILLAWKRAWPFLLVALGYLWYHLTTISTLNMQSVWGNSAYANSLSVRLLTFIQNLYLYVSLLLFPKDLFMERDFTIHIQQSFANPYLFGFIIFMSVLIFILSRHRHASNFKLLVFCYLGFFISFIPYTGIVLINGIFYEHFLYVPLIFFSAFFLFLFEKYLQKKYILYAIITILVIFSLRNIVRQFDWNDSIRFYSQTLIHAPKSVRILNGLGMAYAERGDFTNSLTTYRQGLKINPRVPNIYHNMANIYAAQGKFDLAEKNYVTALQVDPQFIYSAQSLARLYQQTGQQEKLEALIAKYSR